MANSFVKAMTRAGDIKYKAHKIMLPKNTVSDIKENKWYHAICQNMDSAKTNLEALLIFIKHQHLFINERIKSVMEDNGATGYTAQYVDDGDQYIVIMYNDSGVCADVSNIIPKSRIVIDLDELICWLLEDVE